MVMLEIQIMRCKGEHIILVGAESQAMTMIRILMSMCGIHHEKLVINMYFIVQINLIYAFLMWSTLIIL